MPEIISKADAKAKGLKKYFTGIPCKNGHIAERYLSGHNSCMGCNYKYRGENKEKAKASVKRWQKENKHRRVMLQLNEEQRAIAVGTPKPEVCPICLREDVNFALDHCHSTGKFRGYICTSCNVGIGVLQDSSENLKRALKYLEDFEATNS